MESPILFNPDNRLLGGAVGDLSLYGGQSDPKFSIHEARDDALSQHEGVPTASPAAIPQIGEADGPAGSVASDSPPVGDAAGGGGIAAPVSFLITSPGTASDPAAPVTALAPAGTPGPVVATWHPEPQGSGSISPALDQAPTQQPVDSHADAADGVFIGTAATLLDDLAAAPQGVSAVVTPIVDSVGTVVQGTVNAVDDTVATLLNGTTDAVDDTVGTLLNGTTDAVDDTVGTLLNGTTDAVDDTVGTLLNGTANAVDDTIGAVGGLLHSTVSAVDDTLEGLSGSDPAGGVATLVSLISASDMFDLNPVGSAPIDLLGGDSGLGVLDTLVADDPLPDTLLGGQHDDGGLLGDHNSLDHPLGL